MPHQALHFLQLGAELARQLVGLDWRRRFDAMRLRRRRRVTFLRRLRDDGVALSGAALLVVTLDGGVASRSADLSL